MTRFTESRFRNQIALVTGASSGIGRALATELHGLGATLILCARNARELQRTRDLCRGPGEVHVLPLDLTDTAAIEAVARRAQTLTGRIDLVFHCAGIACRDLVERTSVDVDRQVMETNFFGPVALTKALLPSMLRRRSGTFVIVSSLSGRVSVPRLATYGASKRAMEGFFDSLRAEVHASNLRVTIAIPGFVRTPITRNALTGQGLRYGRSMSVHDRGMEPLECARDIVRAVASGKEEVLIGGSELWMIRVQRVCRRLISALVRNHPVRRQQQLLRMLSLGLYGRPGRQVGRAGHVTRTSGTASEQ